MKVHNLTFIILMFGVDELYQGDQVCYFVFRSNIKVLISKETFFYDRYAVK